MVHEQRPGCPSDRHGSVRARRHHGCVCEDSAEASRLRHLRWRQSPAGRASCARRDERVKAERAAYRELHEGPRYRLVLQQTVAGEPAWRIAQDLRVTERTVQRMRARLRERGLLSS